MRTGVHISTIGAAALMVATGSAVAEDPGVLATYTYPIEVVRKAAADSLTDIGCKIEKDQGTYLECARPHKSGMISTGLGGERVSVTFTSASAGVTSVDIRTKKTFVGYVQQMNWDEAVRDGIRQHMLAPAAPKGGPLAQANLARPAPPTDPAPQPKKQETQPQSWIFAQSESSARQAANDSDIGSGLAALAVFAGEVFLASKGYAVAPTPVIVATPSPAPAVSQAPIMCPDGSYVSRPPCTLCPNGHYVGGSSTCSPTQLAPDGTLHSSSGPLKLCPDGTYVTGTVCVLMPNGRYVGN
jgi:hypothetical protein